jgi:hypothetical protein
MNVGEIPEHWEGVYQTKAKAEVSWFEDRPQVSLDLIASTGATPDAVIADIGAGSSRLVGSARSPRSICRKRHLQRPERVCLTIFLSLGSWGTCWIGSRPGTSMSGMTGPRFIF